MRHAFRLLFVAVAATLAAACGDTQRLPAMGEVFSDTLIVYALSGTDVSYPTALNVRELAVVRATGVFDYEIAFDINATGKAILYPMELLVAAEAPFRRVGLQKLNVPFESLTSAPRTGYVYDQPMTLGAGESVAIEAAVACQYPYPQVIFGKLMVDSVSVAKRAIYFHAVSDPSCGFRSWCLASFQSDSMHDLRLLREGVDLLRDGMARRGALEQITPVLERAVALDVERRALIQAAEERKAARNAASEEVARLRRSGGDATEVMTRSRVLGDEIARLERELADTEGALSAMLLEIPNVTLAEVPAGGEDHNVILRESGTPRREEGLRPHWEIGESLGILDLPRGAKIAGSGFVVFRDKGARLVRSFMNFMLDLHTGAHGYEEVWVPFVANRASMTATTQLPKFEEDMYALRDEPLFLVPTAEVPVTNLYRDEILAEADLPMGFTAYTPCFRREAGSHGKDTRGLLRVHEFDKVELVRYTTPETSSAELERLLAHAEAVVQALGLAYRVKLLAAGDTGFASAKTYDIEAWAPGVQQWLEISSVSTFVDFQARRGNIRYRPASGGKPKLVHTLNGSALAFARTIACVLETHQRADGTVEVPQALRAYLGTDTLR